MTHKTLILKVNSAPEEYVGAKQMEFDSQGGTIGRSAQSTFHLEDHNKYLSATHALITCYNGEYYLNDISTNGTFINGKRTLKSQPTVLQEGDSISMGRYEFSAGFENEVHHINLAEDIMPDMKSNDPVDSLNLILPPESEMLGDGTIEDLFLAQDDKADSTEPLAHLQEVNEEAESLIEDEEPNQFVDYNTTQRQILDDSESIHSEMDVPSLIPEDWNAEDDSFSVLNQAQAFSAPGPETFLSPGPEKSIKQTGPAERLTSPTQPSLTEQHIHSKSVRTISKQADSKQAEPSAQPAQQAFLEGLGIPSELQHLCDENWFRQMGLSLKGCLDSLNAELHRSLVMAGESESAKPHLLDSMMSLYQQSVLEPYELIEHIQEELDAHRSRLLQARDGIFQQQLDALSPSAFEAKRKADGGWLKGQRTWKAYQAYFSEQQSNWRTDEKHRFDTSLESKYRELLQEQNA
ncbi:type VI secretion system-associated FHA domain protein TagH [Photobacterium salinisoli]|uniref:type VI secretion system-associated FHA domain protein TagH n=1 Tax=Photobacterium salinisoli TaxID=1616783 RepID=UPI000EA1874A|nr:type VI secretion system-associated FHA domain protein TagH [Photobacterium salinisoli]